MQNNTIYAFRYNPDIHDSGYITISLHYTQRGAEDAMDKHKQTELDKFNQMFEFSNDMDLVFGEYEKWIVEPVLILP